MCDPLTIAIVSTAASAATSLASYAQAQSLQDKQNDANNQWMAYQRQMRNAENQRQEDMRRNTEAARQDTLGTMGADTQQGMQTDEAARLTGDLSQGASEAATADTVGDQLLSGQARGGTEFKTDIANKITQASQAARKRIEALANVQSYGNSFGGLATQNKIQWGLGDEAIGLQNNMRNGSLKAFGVEQQVEPVRYTAGPNMMGAVSSALGSIAGAAGGKAFGSS